MQHTSLVRSFAFTNEVRPRGAAQLQNTNNLIMTYAKPNIPCLEIFADSDHKGPNVANGKVQLTSDELENKSQSTK